MPTSRGGCVVFFCIRDHTFVSGPRVNGCYMIFSGGGGEFMVG